MEVNMTATTIRFKETPEGFALVTTEQTFRQFTANLQEYRLHKGMCSLVNETRWADEEPAIAAAVEISV